MKVATGAGMAEAVSFCLRGSFVPSVEGGSPGPLMVALSWAYYAGRQGWMLQRKFAAAVLGPHGNTGL